MSGRDCLYPAHQLIVSHSSADVSTSHESYDVFAGQMSCTETRCNGLHHT